MMFALSWENWLRLVVWLAIGLAIYFGYSQKHSRLVAHLERELAAGGLSPSGRAFDD